MNNCSTGPEDERAAQSEYINATAIDEENMIPDKGPPHNRIKRQANSAQRPYTIETAIFVDSHLKQRFQNRLHDLQRLVLSIMHEVQLIYNYQSMKVPIKIVVARYEVLDKADNGPNTAGGDIDRYLDNFCSWQARKFRTANSDNRWDHALMLTGYVVLCVAMYCVLFSSRIYAMLFHLFYDGYSSRRQTLACSLFKYSCFSYSGWICLKNPVERGTKKFSDWLG